MRAWFKSGAILNLRMSRKSHAEIKVGAPTERYAKIFALTYLESILDPSAYFQSRMKSKKEKRWGSW